MFVDPFFDNPQIDLDPSDVETPDYVLLTHGHADHIAHVGEFADSTVVGMPELTAYVSDQFVIGDTLPTQVADEESQTFYHAGDTQLMTEMREIMGPYLEPDAAALPIGGHFTMGPWQAAIAVDRLDVDYAFPTHYDTFPPIEQDPRDFEREVDAAGASGDVQVLEGDETFDLGAELY